MWLFIIYKKSPLNCGWKVNGTRFPGSFRWKFSGSNITSEKVELFYPVGLLQKEVRKPLYREKTVVIKTHKTAINRPVDHTGET